VEWTFMMVIATWEPTTQLPRFAPRQAPIPTSTKPATDTAV
jgi:hypothetical protein